jgi:hypothetical protein
MAKLSAAELAKREDVIQKMKKNKRSLVKRYGPDAEKVMYGRATNIAKKVAETQMEKTNLKELVRAALMQEKAGFTDQFDNDPALKGGQKNLPDGLQKAIISKTKGKMEEAINQAIILTDKDHDLLKKNGSVTVRVGNQTVVVALKDFDVDTEDYEDVSDISLEEDLDLGHTDNEPHMLKGDLYRIGKYAMELYQMVDQFEGKGEVDFPHWWQAKIIKAKEMISSAKHYLDFETKEPEIDAMVGAIDMSGALDNVGVDKPVTEQADHVSPMVVKAYKAYLQAKKDSAADVDFAEDPEKAYRYYSKKLNNTYSTRADRDAIVAILKKKYGSALEEGLPKDYWAKKIPGGKMGESLQETNENEDILGDIISDMLKYKTKEEVLAYLKQKMSSLDESYEALVKKIKGQGKSEKAAKAIAGAVASFKAKGGGKGPTAKQKARK